MFLRAALFTSLAVAAMANTIAERAVPCDEGGQVCKVNGEKVCLTYEMLQSDPKHCGSCTNACSSGQTCTSGSCVGCPKQQQCGNACCGRGQKCRNNVCVKKCKTGQTLCGTQNCCTADETCDAGNQCQPKPVEPSGPCQPGLNTIGGRVYNLYCGYATGYDFNQYLGSTNEKDVYDCVRTCSSRSGCKEVDYYNKNNNGLCLLLTGDVQLVDGYPDEDVARLVTD